MNKIVRRIMAFTLGIGALLTASACENFLGSASESIDSQETRTTITAEEWAALEEIHNFTLTLVVQTDLGDPNAGGSKMVRTTKSTETSMYFKWIQDNSVSEESYYFMENGQSYHVTQWNETLPGYDDAWHAYKCDWEVRSMNDSSSEGLEIAYEALVYNAEKKVYEYTMTEDEYKGEFSFRFADGVFSKVTVNFYEQDEATGVGVCVEKFVATFTDVGSTEVTLPEYTVETIEK